MNSTRPRFPERRALACAVLLLACLPRVVAEPPPGTSPPSSFSEPYAEGVEALVEGDARRAADLLGRIVETHGADAEVVLGPVFGNVLYHLGAAYQQLGRYDAAAKAFERCYLNFPNEPGAPEVNVYHALSLAAWAATEQARQRYADAARLYARALKDPAASLDAQELRLNLAVCLGKTEQAEAGARLLAKLLEDPAAERLRLPAFLQLARYHVERGQLAESAGLLNRYAHLQPTMQEVGRPLSHTVLYLATRCAYQQDACQALRWYRWFAADPQATDLADAPDAHAALLGQAHAWFQLNAHRLAHEAYAFLAERPELPKHDEVLLAASLTAAYLDRFEEAAAHAQRLRRDYPRFARWSDAYVLLTDRLLRAGRAREALDLAETARRDLPRTHPAREALDFAAASALYHLASYPEARTEFAGYLEAYPESERAAVAQYTMALCLYHAAQWSEAAARLTEFLEQHPTSPLRDGALFHRADAWAKLGERDKAIADLRVVADLRDSAHRSAACNRLGDLLWLQHDADAALAAFAAADEPLPPGTTHDTARAYSLRRRVELRVATEHWQEALALLDELEARYPLHEELVAAAAASTPAFQHLNQADAGLDRLTGLLLRHAGEPQGHLLETLLQAYGTLCKQVHGYSALLERLAAFPLPDPPAPRLQALLLMARIEALGSIGTTADREAARPLYEQLLRELPTAALTDDALLNVARWLRAAAEPARAAAYYEALEARAAASHDAAYGRIEHAVLLAEQGDAPAAIARLEGLLTADTSSPVREAATLELARLQYRQRAWSQSEAAWRDYLDHADWLQARAEATYRLGACLDRLGRTEEALSMYVTSYVTYEGQVDWASPAFLRSALIAREQGDAARALAILDDMMDRMGHLSHPVVNRARTLHQQWRQAAGEQNG